MGSMPSADHPRFEGFDIVGDVHGCVNSLIELLELLGYRKRQGVYQYHDQRKPRQLVFLGDILDRGPNIREAVLLLREMVEFGSAQVIMGNHEYHALGYTTLNPRSADNSYLRAHNDSHTRSIKETLDQFANHPIDWQDTLRWLYDWPLVLQFEQFRVAHACWDQDLIDTFVTLSPDLTISESILIESQDYRSFSGRLMNRTTRGVSLLLPNNQFMVSSDGFTRRTFRVKFWVDDPKLYRDIEFQPDKLDSIAGNHPLSEQEKSYIPFYNSQQRALFIGHYWLKGIPEPLQHNIACLDYSAVKDGKLVAYRMNRSPTLSAKNFVWVGAEI